MVIAVDGTELYKTKAPQRACKNCSTRTLKNGKVQYYERVVAVSLVGRAPRVLYTIEPQRPGEDEPAAAYRALRQLYAHNPRYADCWTLDALYARAELINLALEQHQDVVVKVRQKERHLIRDAEGLFAKQAPVYSARGVTLAERPGVVYDVELWEAYELTTWDGVKTPLRCLRVKQVRREKQDKKWKESADHYHLGTTLGGAYTAKLVWAIALRRWDMENCIFHDLKTHWHLTHCYHHEQPALYNLYLLYCLAFNLFMLFFTASCGLRNESGISTPRWHASWVKS